MAKITDPSTVGGIKLTPVFANRFYVTINPTFTRIAFGDFLAGNPETDTSYHTAIVLPTVDAVGLGRFLLELFAQNQKDNAPKPCQK